MSEEAEKLLMMFICDTYRSSSGKVSKKTARAMMVYVTSSDDLKWFVTSSDYKSLLAYRADKEVAK